MTVLNAVTSVPAADPETAARHARHLLSLESDCWDVHDALHGSEDPGFLLIDVRGPEGFAAGHIAGAINRYHAGLTDEWLADIPVDRLLVVYCAGPHCNGADKAMLRLAELGRPVKKMIGGITGWLDEGFELVSDR